METPKTLLMAVNNSLINQHGRVSHVNREVISQHVKDFLAQHFNVAMLKNPNETEMLKELFERLTRK